MSADPLGGPEGAELQPFKIVGQLIGARYDADGNVVGEEFMGEITIYRPLFGKVDQIVDEATARARKATQ